MGVKSTPPNKKKAVPKKDFPLPFENHRKTEENIFAFIKTSERQATTIVFSLVSLFSKQGRHSIYKGKISRDLLRNFKLSIITSDVRFSSL
jgi:hypothetical protein